MWRARLRLSPLRFNSLEFRLWRVLRRRPKKPPAQPVEQASIADYELLYTLCTTWPQGLMAQAYMATPTRVLAPMAAAEIRCAIEGSFYAAFDIGSDWIALLRRIESDPGQDLK